MTTVTDKEWSAISHASSIILSIMARAALVPGGRTIQSLNDFPSAIIHSKLPTNSILLS